ncbi:hypothetical protein MM_1099 [Methanosarcina mazei Go1]|uniref:Uncharacterized protein n=1 Tax=Methanosarcina mazei (strain ATCC BAA-159 / DSM 3647 / Goe1 / Go1 / JCM 11833 / OCM 88) TaxID=192952 RepID=Q8PXW7_METMA|nr:hypothetical protein MM_1099 [Methanosarcina mazei Go1]
MSYFTNSAFTNSAFIYSAFIYPTFIHSAFIYPTFIHSAFIYPTFIHSAFTCSASIFVSASLMDCFYNYYFCGFLLLFFFPVNFLYSLRPSLDSVYI